MYAELKRLSRASKDQAELLESGVARGYWVDRKVAEKMEGMGRTVQLKSFLQFVFEVYRERA